MKFVDDTPHHPDDRRHAFPGWARFTARVFFHGDLYAGTWEHVGSGGGHMFGRIERGAAQR